MVDDVFWMLPFRSARQAKQVRQFSNVTEDLWNACRKAIMAEHRLPSARTELEQSWKERLIRKSAAADGAVAAPVLADGNLQFDETEN